MKISIPFEEGDLHLLGGFFGKQTGVIVYPTETFYAIGCKADQDLAVKAVYKAKKRSFRLPMLVLINSWEMLNEHAWVNANQMDWLKQFWPGALSVVLRTKNTLSSVLNAVDDTLAFRMTSDPVASHLIELAGIPLVGTSANLSGQSEADEVHLVADSFDDQVDLYVDGGKTPGGQASTLVKLSDDAIPHVLRQGAMKLL